MRRFQEENGLVVDGCLGKSTVDLLKSGDADPFVFTVGVEGDDVQRIQERLAHFGYLSHGQVTGYFGDKTQAAVKSFQSRNGLTEDGSVNYETMQLLLSEEAEKAPTTPKPATPKPTKKPHSSKKPTATPKPGTTPKPTKKPTPTPNDGDTGSSGHTINYGQGKEAFIQRRSPRIRSRKNRAPCPLWNRWCCRRF